MTYIGFFEVSAALAVLDIMADRARADSMPSAEEAWEAAWIACLTNSARWADEAEARFSDVLTDLGRRVRPRLTSFRP